MDRTILIEYADMKEEIKDLRRRIEKDKRALEKLNKETVIDTVSRGKKGRKSLGTARVEGKPRMTIELKKNAYIKKIDQLEQLETDLLEKQRQVEEYIQQIEKSKLRMIFQLYYVDGLTWEMVAMKMNNMFPRKKIPFTKDGCRMMHNRFLEKVL